MGLKRCDWCNERMPEDSGAGRPTRFCCIKHATAYHNELKRMERQRRILTNEVLRLSENLARGGEISKEALRQIRGLMPCLASSAHVNITCAKCGQKRLLMPENWEKCSFCGQDEWIISKRDLQESK